jgi:transcriptional regulator with XRE-family HTH domain
MPDKRGDTHAGGASTHVVGTILEWREGMDTNIEKIGFGDRLKQLMAVRGFSQSALAKRSGVERTVINRMISGKAKPRHEQIGWMAQALGVDAYELLIHADPSELRRLTEQLHEARARIAELEQERDAALAQAERIRATLLADQSAAGT